MAPLHGALTGLPWGVVVGLALLGLLLLEWGLGRARAGVYYRVGFPLPLEPLPIDQPPQETGSTPTVDWALDGPVARYWSGRAGLPGLHGEVTLLPHRGRYRLDVRWAPPWSLLVLAAALGFVGRTPAAALVSLALVVGVLVVYYQAAVRAAAELRYHWAEEPRRPG